MNGHVTIIVAEREEIMMKKLLVLALVCAVCICGIPINASASTITFKTCYGTATGSSSTYTWSQSTSPDYRKIKATTSNDKAAPKIAASVVGYKNGNKVMSDSNSGTNVSSVTAEKNSTSYVHDTITGTGTHAVWSSTLARKDYITRF